MERRNVIVIAKCCESVLVWCCFSAKGNKDKNINGIIVVINMYEYWLIIFSDLPKKLFIRNIFLKRIAIRSIHRSLLVVFLCVKHLKPKISAANPDMNPVENVFVFIKTKVEEKRQKTL